MYEPDEIYTMAVNGVAYVRVSTDRQSQGASLDTQRDAIRDYAVRNGIAITHEYCDILSGTREDRPRYLAMLEQMQVGDVCLVWRLDRVGRNKAELFRFFDHCKRHRISLISVTQPDLSNELVRDIMSVLAAYEAQQLAERVVPNMVARAKEGRWMGRTPRWLRISAESGHLEPAEDAADAQRAFDLFLATRNVEATAVAFGANTDSMRQWLRNRAYIGEATWRGVTVPNAHPAIVKAETFHAVNAVLDGRKRTGRREPYGTALLTGVIYVRGTDRRMYHHRDKRTTRRWYTTQAADGALPRYSVDADAADAFAVEQLLRLNLTPEASRRYERDVRERVRRDPDKRVRATLMRQRAVLIDEQVATDRMRARREIDTARWERMRGEQQREIDGIAHRLALLAPLPDPAAALPLIALRVDLAAAIARAWEARNIAALRALVEAFVARVEVETVPTEGLRGAAAAYWVKNPPSYAVRWSDAVVLH